MLPGAPRGSLTLPRMNAHRLVVTAAALTTEWPRRSPPRWPPSVARRCPGRPARPGPGDRDPAAVQRERQRRPGRPVHHRPARADLRGAGGHRVRLLPGRVVRPARVRARLAARHPGQRGQPSRSPRRPPSAAWPARPSWSPEAGPARPTAGQPIPAALPASAAALLHVGTGDVLRLRDRITQHYVRFVVTGLYRPRQVSAPYWQLDRDRAVRLEHGQWLHHVRPAHRAARGVRAGRCRSTRAPGWPRRRRPASRPTSSPRSRPT